MKNKLIFIATITLFAVMLFIYNIEGFEVLNKSKSIKSVDTISNEEFKNIKSTRIESEYDLLNMKYEDNRIPYDKNEDIYYLCKYNEDYNFSIGYSYGTVIKKIVNNDTKSLKIIAYKKNKYKIYNICLTELPIININLADKSDNNELISKDYTYGDVTILDNETNKNTLKIMNQSAKFKIRGGSSTLYEKKSYSVQFIDSKSGENLVVENLLGLDKNSSFALNSIYEDNSKIRDILSLELYKNINKNNFSQINMKYVEVFINNQYYGLYGASEIPNQYKLDVVNEDSVIYKINAHKIPLLDSFNDDYLYTDTTEIEYPNKPFKEIWKPFVNLTELVYYSDNNTFSNQVLDFIDIDNCVNYFILMQLSYDADGLWKNNVLNYDESTKKFIKIPWDLDLTWGSYWDQTNKLFVDYDKSLSTKFLMRDGSGDIPTYLEQRLWENNVGNFRQKVAKRWKVLRSEFLETESFINYSNQLYNKVTSSGAREREHKRWPNGGYSEDNEFIETFIRERLEYLDSKFLKY